MSWLIGAGIGMFFGGPLGAIAGGVLEHIVTQKGDTNYTTYNNTTGTSINGETIFITNLAAIAAKVAMADGAITNDKRRVIHDFFAKRLGYKGKELEFIDGIITETEKQNPDLLQICQSFRQYSTLEIRMLFADFIYQIASIDNIISDKEQLEIDLICTYIGISHQDSNRIKYKYRGSPSNGSAKSSYYKILGIEKTASDEEIKKAYKQMALQYHPDKVSHLGSELIDFANKKFKEINEAYSHIKKERGI